VWAKSDTTGEQRFHACSDFDSGSISTSPRDHSDDSGRGRDLNTFTDPNRNSFTNAYTRAAAKPFR
jgi:hypothetical protein